MIENEITDRILDCCFKVHRNLGPGLFESVYEETLAYEMSGRGLVFDRQKAISLTYGEIKLDVAFRADFIVEKKVIVELKWKIPGISDTHSGRFRTRIPDQFGQ